VAVSETTDGYLLPCGQDVDRVWQRLAAVEAGQADEHEATCPHCGAARRSLTMLRDLTGELAAERPTPSIDLTGRIMAAVRAEVRRHDPLPLDVAESGGVLVSARAVAAVLRFAADRVDGVRARRCRVTAAQDAGELVFDVEMSVAVSYRGFARHALDEVRVRLRAAADARVGIRLGRLDLILDDLYDA
jgi:hypothetical protein